jgi:hypothetical protein
MKVIFDSYGAGEEIPVGQYLKNRKLKKYFNRETAAAVVGVGKLSRGIELHPATPFYYAAGLMEYEDYGFIRMIERSIDANGGFSQKRFVEEGMPGISPLSQFKVLQNMPLSFVAIENQLTGDNAVIYTSASGLLLLALHSVFNGPMLLGAGKTGKDGNVAIGFAYVEKKEIENSPFLSGTADAVDMFRAWASGG